MLQRWVYSLSEFFHGPNKVNGLAQFNEVIANHGFPCILKVSNSEMKSREINYLCLLKGMLTFYITSTTHSTLRNTIVKIRISAQRKCPSTKTLSVVQFFMLISLPVLLILREFSISNNSV